MLTGARPYAEMAIVTADHVLETPQGMFYLLKARTHDGKHGHKAAKKTGKKDRQGPSDYALRRDGNHHSAFDADRAYKVQILEGQFQKAR